MRTDIKNIAERLGYEITDWDVEQIIEHKFHLLVAGRIKAAIKSYFE